MPSSVNSARTVPKKFQVAFSYAGEDRALVSAIAAEVERRLGTGTVFYDRWYEHYIAGKNGDLKLQRIYREHCELAVVCVSKSYNDKIWTLTEHDAIRDRLLKVRNSADKGAHYHGVLHIGVAEGRLDDMLSMDIVPDVSKTSVQETAELIIGRLKLALQDRKEDGSSPQSLPRIAGSGTNVIPTHLQDLCDRHEQEGALAELFEKTTKDCLRRPMLIIVHGVKDGAHTAFIHRMCREYLPARLKNLRLADEIQLVQPPGRFMAKTVAELSREVRKKLADGLQFAEPCTSDEQLLGALGSTCSAVIAPVFHLSCREAFTEEKCYLQMLLECWSQLPDLPPDRALIGFICVKYLHNESGGLFSRIWSSIKTNPALRLRQLIEEIRLSSEAEGKRVLSAVLPELTHVRLEDVERWFHSAPVTRHKIPPLFPGEIQSILLNNELQQPMEHVLGALKKYIKDHT